MKWALQRCQFAPRISFLTAAWMPAWASEMHKLTRFRPRFFSSRKNSRQELSDSSNISSTARISLVPELETPMGDHQGERHDPVLDPDLVVMSS